MDTKRILRFACLASALLWASAASAQPRITRSIDRDWEFFPENATSSDMARRVNLPHTWNNDTPGGNADYRRGSGNYQKTLDMPYEWNGRRLFLRCGGAADATTLLVNGRAAGEHIGAYTPFTSEITDLIHSGKQNTVRLITSNAQRQDIFPLGGDHNVYGGLFRGVEIVVTGENALALASGENEGIRIIQKKVSEERAEGDIVVAVNGIRDNTATVNAVIRTTDGDTVERKSAKVKLNGRATSSATIPFSIQSPRLWQGTDDPFLYEVHISVEANGKVTDHTTLTTGFRTISVEPSGSLSLNGKRYPVRGVAVTQDRAVYGPALTRGDVENDFALIREMGANTIRIKDFMHHPYFYELCDREGILVWNDFPIVGEAYLTDIGFLDTHALRSNGQRQVADIVNTLYNHPSVVMWGLFSDLSLRGDDPVEYLRSLNTMVKREDPSRPTVASSTADGEINFITDLIVWNHHFGWQEGMPGDIDAWLSALHANWGNLRSAVSYKAGASVRQQSGILRRPDPESTWHPEGWQTYLHEEYFCRLAPDSMLWGIVVNNMFDYGAAGRTWGEGNGINDYGLVTLDRAVKKDAFYLYKANWNPSEQFIRIAGKRHTVRHGTAHTIHAYTTAAEAELYVNGNPAGMRTANYGIVEWDGIVLKPGHNAIEVRSGDMSDSCELEILPAKH